MQGVEYTDGGETADGLAACMLVCAGVRWCVLGYGAPVPREPARERVAAAHRLEVGPAAAAVGAHHDHVRHAVEEVEEAERHHLAGLGPGSGLGLGLRKARLATCYAPGGVRCPAHLLARCMARCMVRCAVRCTVQHTVQCVTSWLQRVPTSQVSQEAAMM